MKSIKTLYKTLRSGSYPEKLKALRILDKRDIYTDYVICQNCDRVGREVYRTIKGKERRFVYHYYAGSGKYYCAISDAQMDRKKRRITCPKCGQPGLYSKMKAANCGYWDPKNADRYYRRYIDAGYVPPDRISKKRSVYGVTRVIVRHGKRICHINKEHLKIIRKKHSFGDTKITTAHGVLTYSNEKRFTPKRRSRNKGKYDISDVANRLGLSLVGEKRIHHIIRTLQGQLEAKKAGKNIRFDVEERIQKWEEELDSVIQQKKTPAKPEAMETEDPLLKDEWFLEHQKKLGWNNHQQDSPYSEMY